MLYFQSTKPISYYFLLGLLAFTIVLFSIFAIIGRLDISSSVICIIGINLLAFYLIGRYLCILNLSENKIILTYIYPFKIIREYKFKGISEVDSRNNYEGLEPTFNRGFYRLYLTDNDGKLLDIKYNISEKENREFITLLKKSVTRVDY